MYAVRMPEFGGLHKGPGGVRGKALGFARMRFKDEFRAGCGADNMGTGGSERRWEWGVVGVHKMGGIGYLLRDFGVDADRMAAPT